MYAGLLKRPPPQWISSAEFQFANRVLEYSSSTCALDILKSKPWKISFQQTLLGAKKL